MAVELATAYVTLTVSAKGIAGDIERQVVPAAGAAGSKAGGAIASGMKTALAGFAVVGFMKGAFSEMEEAQKVAGQTAAVIASTGGAAGLSAAGFEDRASAISKNVGLDDELIQSSENLLATFTNIQNNGPDKVFDRATVAAVDLGAAMKMGPEAAAMQLGKALQDPVAGVNRLSRAGVQLSATQKQQVADFAAVGDMAAAQGVILGEVERQVGGSAAAQATSADHMRVAFGNLQESVGTGLAPALTGLANIGTRVFEAFSGLPGPLQQGILLAGAGGLIWNRFGDGIGSAIDRVKAMIVAQKAQIVASGQQVAANAAVSLSFSTVAASAVAGIAAYVGTTKALDGLAKSRSAQVTADGLATSLDTLNATGRVSGEVAQEFGSDLSGLAESFNAVDKSAAGKIFSFDLPQSALADIDQFDQHFKNLVQSGNVEQAQAEVGAFSATLMRQGVTAEQIGRGLGQYYDALDIAGDVAAASAVQTDDYTASVQAAHQANKDALLGTAARIAKDAEFRASLNQVKDSIEAYAENERNAAGTGAEAAKIRADSARNQVANAKAVEQAEQNLVSAGRAVEQAQRGVADAYRARDAAVRGVAQAEQGVIDAERGREGAVRNLATANATLAASQQRSVQLARDLSGAFDAARESLDDLNRSAAGDKLSVKSAEFALADARLAAAQGPDDPGAPNAQAKLNLAVAQAELALAEARDRATESAENLNERTAAGLDQSPEVLAAQQAVADNASTIATNQQSVADAHVAVEASDRTLAEAHQRVADAQVAVRAADQAIIDAKDQVVGARDAQRIAAEDLATAEKTAADEIVIADFLVWLSKDAAQKKSTELKDQVVADFGLMFTAAETYGLGLAGVNAWLITLTKGLDPASPLRQNIDSLLAQLTPITIPAPSGGGGGGGVGLGTPASGALGGPTPIYGPTGAITGYRPASVSARSGEKAGVTVNGDLVVNAGNADGREVAEYGFTYVARRVRVR